MFSVDSEQLEKTLFSGLLTGHCQSASSRVKVQHSSEFSVSAFSSLSKVLIWIETETELIFLTDSLTSLTSLSVGNCGDPSRGAFGGRAPRCLQEKFESGSRTWTRFRCIASHSSYSAWHSNFNFVSELCLGSAAFFIWGIGGWHHRSGDGGAATSFAGAVRHSGPSGSLKMHGKTMKEGH